MEIYAKDIDLLREKIEILSRLIEDNYFDLVKIVSIEKLLKLLKSYSIIEPKEIQEWQYYALKHYSELIISCINNGELFKIEESAVKTFVECLEGVLQTNRDIFISKIANKISEIEFLHDKINDLEKEKTVLKGLSEKEKIEKDNEIAKYKELLEKSEQEKKELISRAEEEKKRQEQIRNDWNTNIENAFKALNDGAKSINDEYKRVQDSFYLYKYGLVIDIILLGIYILFLIYFCLKNKPTEYIEFVPYHLPLLFFATLIWVCVSQMNKAQRQLIAFSDKIYRIKYLEGSLKGLNHVERDKEILAQKTTEVLSKIIDKHLNESFKSMDEKTIIKEEKKDSNEDINVIRIMINALNKAIEK